MAREARSSLHIGETPDRTALGGAIDASADAAASRSRAVTRRKARRRRGPARRRVDDIGAFATAARNNSRPTAAAAAPARRRRTASTDCRGAARKLAKMAIRPSGSSLVRRRSSSSWCAASGIASKRATAPGRPARPGRLRERRSRSSESACGSCSGAHPKRRRARRGRDRRGPVIEQDSSGPADNDATKIAPLKHTSPRSLAVPVTPHIRVADGPAYLELPSTLKRGTSYQRARRE